jgi:hypothetical protein
MLVMYALSPWLSPALQPEFPAALTADTYVWSAATRLAVFVVPAEATDAS